MSVRILVRLGVLGAILAGCAGDEDIDGFSPAEWDVLRTLSPLGAPPPDTTNKYADDPKAAVLGQRFFFEKRFSGPIVVGN
ncbi:MAG TPA: hypothetical protein VJT73_18335, partial [Polyangiaceae bacterium]|nr:hypothetical protein [Polyangiaceae bacterium]